jgi:hypothetical protein
MGKKLMLAAAYGLSLGCLLPIGVAIAQTQAPVGHRQPTASEVPGDDSVRGDVNLSGAQPSTQPPAKRSRGKRARGDMEVIMKTPNICSNCNE